MAVTQAQLDALDDAIASGALSVSHNGKTVTYRSLEEMREVRAILVAQLTPAASRRSPYAVAGHRRTS